MAAEDKQRRELEAGSQAARLEIKAGTKGLEWQGYADQNI
jgi:hypothetical protein